MILKNQKWDKILSLFFENPNKSFTIREISKQTKVPTSSAQRYVEKMKELEILTIETTLNQTPYVKYLKAGFLTEQLFTTGLLDFLEKKLVRKKGVLLAKFHKTSAVMWWRKSKD